MQGSPGKRSLEQRRWNCIPKSHLRPKNRRVHSLAIEHSPDPVMRPYKEPVSAELREHLSRAIADPLQVIIELSRCRDAAARLVGSAWAQRRIVVLADALMRHGALNREEIFSVGL
jgi:hypothetical protein